MARLRRAVQIVRRPALAKGFVLLPKRWRAERTFGAGRFCRRLPVDHETLPHVAESMVHLASTIRFLWILMAEPTCRTGSDNAGGASCLRSA
ncbi:MAG TPA: hypothetical protein VHG30_02785 [Microvirga sp.]|nr:hypothetical protein [Microvirga sp.]